MADSRPPRPHPSGANITVELNLHYAGIDFPLAITNIRLIHSLEVDSVHPKALSLAGPHTHGIGLDVSQIDGSVSPMAGSPPPPKHATRLTASQRRQP